MNYYSSFNIGKRTISNESPTYFIADIGANHDGSLERAKKLINLAKESGADCAKFQHFRANKIVSREGFEGLKTAHQKDWDKPVYETYADYSLNRDWNNALAETAKDTGIDFMTTPYDFDAVDCIEPLVEAYKIGSGDITYLEHIRYIAGKGKPVFLATGASNFSEVEAAVAEILPVNPHLCLMQCNTNYTGDHANASYANLRVLDSYALRWPGLPLGLSDHTTNHITALGAVALGARVIEKHFTDDSTRNGPDHKFALTVTRWAEMVWQVRELEKALGDGIKVWEDNERESRIVQRRAVRVKRDLPAGAVLMEEDLESLRPCPSEAFTPADMNRIVGQTLSTPVLKGEALFPIMLSIA